MAYVSQEKKAKIAAALKTALKGVDIKWSLAVDHHSEIVCTVRSGSVDFIGNYNAREVRDIHFHHVATTDIDVNHYHPDHAFSGDVLAIIEKIIVALNTDNFDHSDTQTDYFCVGHYVSLKIGRWNKPYTLTAKK